MAVQSTTTEKIGETLSQEQLWFAEDAIRSLADELGVKVTKKYFEIALIREAGESQSKTQQSNGSISQAGSWAVRYIGEEGLENITPEPEESDEPMAAIVINIRRTSYNSSEGIRISHHGWATRVEPVVAEGDNVPTPTIYIPGDM